MSRIMGIQLRIKNPDDVEPIIGLVFKNIHVSKALLDAMDDSESDPSNDEFSSRLHNLACNAWRQKRVTAGASGKISHGSVKTHPGLVRYHLQQYGGHLALDWETRYPDVWPEFAHVSISWSCWPSAGWSVYYEHATNLLMATIARCNISNMHVLYDDSTVYQYMDDARSALCSKFIQRLYGTY